MRTQQHCLDGPPALRLTNVEEGETIHQRCLLITGTCSSNSSEDFISIKTTGSNNLEAFPEQTWPVHSGYFKALVMLSPGSNTLEVIHMQHDGELVTSIRISLQYIPLLQYPPLHLAIMVAKDSPLLMDCPPQKSGGFSSAHSDLSAAVEKFRMTAYMWQAMTAEEMRLKNLGRRTFRLEEEWTTDTVSRDFINARHSEHHACDDENAIRSTAKINIVRSSKTKKEILYAEGNDTSPTSNTELFGIFIEALAQHGGQFDRLSSPVVAGLILDAHYNKCSEQAFGHVNTGRHNSSGISLGTFGSHLTYSWPRFTEEISSCLTDARVPGAKLSNGESAIWESCALGQSSFLSAVGLAFGAKSGPKSHGQQDWRRNFLPGANKPDASTEDDEAMTDCGTWSLKDALNLRLSPHFLLPTDKPLTEEERTAIPSAEPKYMDNEHGELDVALRIKSPVGVVRISFNKTPEATPSINSPASEREYGQEELEARFDRSQPLHLDVLGFNGEECTITDVWKALAIKTFVRIPGSSVRLFKRSVYTDQIERNPDEDVCEWAQLLKERGSDGNIHRATSIDLRVGCWWDGGVVQYADGHKSHWGPMHTGGRPHRFGGHASQKIELPPNINIKRIEVNRGGGGRHMSGVRMRLTNRTVRGELNRSHGSNANIVRLEPASHEVIVGFYGKSGLHDGVMEFGIITAPKSVGLDGLPESVFDLPELKNTVGMENGAQTAGDHEEHNDDEEYNDDDDDDDDDHTMDGDE